MERVTVITIIGIVLCILLIVLSLICCGNASPPENPKTITNFGLRDVTREGLFNMSYSPVKHEGIISLVGYGRSKDLSGVNPPVPPAHAELYEKIIPLFGSSPSKDARLVKLPTEVKDTYVGEVKGYILNGDFHIYTNFRGERDTLGIFPNWISDTARNLYFKNDSKNYLWNTTSNRVVPLFYEIPPGKGFTHKNFLFFEHHDSHGTKKHLVVTSISPHIIYQLDIGTGYIYPHSKTTNDKLEDFFHTDYNLFLSGGPVRIPSKNCYLVAGHVSKGGWGGTRMTFFYTFRDEYPFDILSVSEPLSFGFSNRLEYCNQIFLHENHLYVSLGIEDEYSVLLYLHLDTVFSTLTPIKNLLKDMLKYAIYFPQFHEIQENNVNFYRGYTDIVNLGDLKTPDKETPSHKYLPLRSIRDYNLEQNTRLIQSQVNLLKKYNVDGFATYHYWFSDNNITGNRMIMEKINRKLLSSNLGEKRIFYIWANEDWTNNHHLGGSRNRIGNSYTTEDRRKHCDYLLNVFSQPGYLKIDNKPVFFIHHPWQIDGNLPKFRAMLSDSCKSIGFDGVFLSISSYGIDGITVRKGGTSYYDHHPHYKKKDSWAVEIPGSPFNFDYARYVDSIELNADIQTIFFDFDNRARLHKGKHSRKSTVCYNNVEREFIKYLKKIKDKPPKILLINAWNEWGEKMHVEPSNEKGPYYLELINRYLSP